MAIKEHANNLNQIIRARTENCDRRGVCGVSTKMLIERDRVDVDGRNPGVGDRPMVAAAARGCRPLVLRLQSLAVNAVMDPAQESASLFPRPISLAPLPYENL